MVVMRIEVVNTQEDAHDSILSFNLTDNIVFSGVDSEVGGAGWFKEVRGVKE